MLFVLQSLSPYLDTRSWCFGFARKAFLSTIFLIINFHPWTETNVDNCNNLHFFWLWALQSCCPYLDTRYWRSGFARKDFFSTIFLMLKVHSWNKMNQDTCNNLHFFCYWHYNNVLHIGIHDINALDLQEMLFFPAFSLWSEFIREFKETWILIIISILFVLSTRIMFSSLGYTILML